MKRCPQCNRVETEDALAFCRVDGTALVSDPSSSAGEGATFSWLDKAVANRSVILGFLKLEPLLESLRSDARWKDLDQRAGVSP